MLKEKQLRDIKKEMMKHEHFKDKRITVFQGNLWADRKLVTETELQAAGLLQWDRGRGDRKIQDINSNQTKRSDFIKFYVHNIQRLSINDMIDEVFTALYDFVCFTETWQKECVKRLLK